MSSIRAAAIVFFVLALFTVIVHRLIERTKPMQVEVTDCRVRYDDATKTFYHVYGCATGPRLGTDRTALNFDNVHIFTMMDGTTCVREIKSLACKGPSAAGSATTWIKDCPPGSYHASNDTCLKVGDIQ